MLKRGNWFFGRLPFRFGTGSFFAWVACASAQTLPPALMIITHFARPNERRKSLTLRLEQRTETVLVGEVEF